MMGLVGSGLVKTIMNKIGLYAVGIGLTVAAAAMPLHPLRAQNTVPPGLGQPIPEFAGTGLFGIYYDNGDGFSSSKGSPPQASFTTTNLCFPDCQGNSFNDGTGGLASFLGNNATGISILDTQTAPRGTWDNSELDIGGYIAITQPGTYQFTVGSDDFTYLTIEGMPTQSILGGGPQTFSEVFSTAGLYAIAVQFLEFSGGSRLSFVGTDPNGNCYFGCYNADNVLLPNSLFYSQGQLDGAPAPVIGGGWISAAFAALLGAGVVVRRRLARV